MKRITQEELNVILEKHKLWLENKEGGERAFLSGSDLSGSDLSGSDLRGSDLRGSDLSDSDLRGSNLSDSNLRGVSGNRVEIKSIFISETYPITYTSEYLQIGCKRYLISDWWKFNGAAIKNMDGQKALDFWNKYKELIKTIIEHSPARKTGKEQ